MDEEVQQEIDRLQDAYLALARAMLLMNQALHEVAEHNAEHHEVINGLGRSVELLENLMIGGDNETPTA